MNQSAWQKICDLWRSEFFSPKHFLKWAIYVAIIFAIAHLCGLREFTSILNGTTGSVGMSRERTTFLGSTYVILYLAFILIVPTFLLTAVILLAWRKTTSGRKLPVHESGKNSSTPD
jgi:hypothetical protein